MKLTKKITIFFLVLVSILLTQNMAVAAILDMGIADKYYEGDTIILHYTIRSAHEETINYIVSINCPFVPLAPLNIESITLHPNRPIQRSYTYLTVDDSIEPQTCTASVSITEPYNLITQEDFRIITDPSFNFRIISCKDEDCDEQSKVFLTDEKVFLDYISDVPDPTITASFTDPDGKLIWTGHLFDSVFPNPGTYTITGTASKPGYKTNEFKYKFGVIEEPYNPSYIPSKQDSYQTTCAAACNRCPDVNNDGEIDVSDYNQVSYMRLDMDGNGEYSVQCDVRNCVESYVGRNPSSITQCGTGSGSGSQSFFSRLRNVLGNAIRITGNIIKSIYQ